jgi:hypothetical protein
MNTNLSSSQFSSNQQSMTKMGAMPLDSKYDGPSPIKQPSFQNNMAPNANVPLAKPGFF